LLSWPRTVTFPIFASFVAGIIGWAIMPGLFFSFLMKINLILFLWCWSWNWGLCTCWTSALPLNYSPGIVIWFYNYNMMWSLNMFSCMLKY
jgi:hypothetical protein